MTLGTKIGMGFGLLILIAMILGGIAVWNMKNVGKESNKLATEYAPEVELANEIERNALLTMYAMRGYAFTDEQNYLTTGEKRLSETKKTLDEIKALADRSPDLVKLRSAVPEAQKGVALYEQLAQETVAINANLAKQREKMDAAAAVYMQEALEFLDSQKKAMEKEIGEGAGQARLSERLQKINLINEIIDIGNATRVGNFRAQASRDPELLKTAISGLDAVNREFEQLSVITRQPLNIRQMESIQKAGNQYREAMSQFLADWLKREELGKRRTAAGEEVLSRAQATSEAGITETLSIATLADNSLSQASNVMIVGLIVALLVGVLMAFFITRNITRAINRVVEGLSEGAEQVASASSQVSSASQSLAEGASEQAASIEETSSSLEEMSSMTRQNADNASQADTLMKEANQVVTTANQSMGELTRSMEEISRASEETSKIIKTIDEIAFQTNLLALNAAVEAARAGEAGAGFAVVADEVRNLAMRAADAAKNTANLIEGTVKQVKDGGELVSRTNENFSEVARSSAKVGELVAEIAAASSEQAQGISQVNTAVNEVDKVTQQNAANAEESASAAEEMNAQAEQMKGFVAELVALVGAAKNSDTTLGARKSASRETRTVLHHPVAHLSLHAGNGKGNGKGNGAAKGSSRSKTHATAGAGKQPTPEQMIPLDKDFADF
jgi:methyl-accepting chemotaxis protein